MGWLRRLQRPATAWTLASLTVFLAVALVPLSLAARQNPFAAGAAYVVIGASFAAVGLVVAWHRPANPIGWLMLTLGVSYFIQIDTGLYNVVDYRLGHRLPLAPVMLILYHASEPGLVLVPLLTLLFPDWQLPSRRWRWMAGGALALAAADVMVQVQMSLYAITHHRTQVDAGGQLLLSNAHSYVAFFAPVSVIFFAFWALSAGYQVVRWRRAADERRQQLSWLMAGGAAALISFLAAVVANALPHDVRAAATGVLVCGVAALPVGMGVAILKYRLYEIDRIISRTLAYAIVTGLLAGVYSGLVLLATHVLSVSSPLAVAAATLAAAALFNPARRRVQLSVDRWFNRARYDADRTVAAFAARLNDTVDLESVRGDLASVIQQVLEPVHVSVWVSQRTS